MKSFQQDGWERHPPKAAFFAKQQGTNDCI